MGLSAVSDMLLGLYGDMKLCRKKEKNSWEMAIQINFEPEHFSAALVYS